MRFDLIFTIFINTEPEVYANTMNIDQAQEPDYESVKIDYVGFVDPYAVEGMVVLKADNGKEFHMRAFSG